MARRWRGNGTGRGLACADGMAAVEIHCLEERNGWTEPVVQTSYRVYIARSGSYLRRLNGVSAFVDATDVLVAQPGDEISVAHPLGSGDTGTVIELTGEFVARLGEDGTRLLPGERRLDDRLDLQHRALVAAGRAGLDSLTSADAVLGLLDQLCQPGGVAPERRRGATVVAHRRLVDRARQALVAGGLAVGLDPLAASVGCSPHHLSRVFRLVTGESLSTYRNRLRVRAVLSDLQDGADSLRVLAAEYGFADQAHLSRVMRRQLGRTPSELRRLVTASDRA
jgi:AraC-like DNA-binding protein